MKDLWFPSLFSTWTARPVQATHAGWGAGAGDILGVMLWLWSLCSALTASSSEQSQGHRGHCSHTHLPFPPVCSWVWGFFPPACAWGLGFFPPVCAWVLVFSTVCSWGLFFFFPSVPGFWFLTIVFAGQHQLCHCFSLFGAIRLHLASPGKRGIRALAMRRDGGTETAQGEIWGMS